VEALNRIPDDFTQHLDALCWLWKGPQAKGFESLETQLPSRREMLPRLLEHLAELIRSETTQPDVLRDARTKIRTTLSSDKYKHYRAVIEDMGDSLAFTVYWTVDRLDGLGQVVRSETLNIIRDTYPHLFIKEKADPWTDDSIVYTTEAGMNKREEELNYLLNVKIPENAKAIGEAASHGDLSENSEYKFALEERDLLQSRVASIQDELSRARTISWHDVSTDRVHIGTRIVLTNAGGDQQHEVTILGPWDADLEKRILNYRAPICQKLKGRSIGDTILLDLDGGEQEYRIVEIKNALE
jgi:transcription elongation factor GreA